mmetsp:Transcript_53308/g.133825  ORF Transcript_53308/g.133825 Transcript_53308/m.133825 type:complete len:400 (-) Transcript_53308:135-1334(-)
MASALKGGEGLLAAAAAAQTKEVFVANIKGWADNVRTTYPRVTEESCFNGHTLGGLRQRSNNSSNSTEWARIVQDAREYSAGLPATRGLGLDQYDPDGLLTVASTVKTRDDFINAIATWIDKVRAAYPSVTEDTSVNGHTLKGLRRRASNSSSSAEWNAIVADARDFLAGVGQVASRGLEGYYTPARNTVEVSTEGGEPLTFRLERNDSLSAVLLANVFDTTPLYLKDNATGELLSFGSVRPGESYTVMSRPCGKDSSGAKSNSSSSTAGKLNISGKTGSSSGMSLASPRTKAKSATSKLDPFAGSGRRNSLIQSDMSASTMNAFDNLEGGGEVSHAVSEWESLDNNPDMIKRCDAIMRTLNNMGLDSFARLRTLTAEQWSQLPIPTGLRTFLRNASKS